MLRSLINGGVFDWLYSTICMFPGIIMALSLHEFAHAYVADKCGDPTPRYMGRVSVDPKAHVDWFGIVSLVLIHFGWGKPVLVNPHNFKKMRRDSIFVGIAGVSMNFALGTVFGIALRLVLLSRAANVFFVSTTAGKIILDIWLDIVVINYSLMLFNLLPVPPLDGFGILSDIFNLRGTTVWEFVYKNSMLIMIVLILFDIPSFLLSRPINWLVRAVCFGIF